ncbi:hypothetical protein PGT21_005210 [Puccinia graminis f. sp. tritici]|uniref:Uncharacterized protein n=2 Tax=Puccinia graminis f. sp. tritici TaxID=56615 RepID=E3JTR4_PUCGT|nr:uncharacterized protein PGTG_00796 [Puccinia graminis f. sp. tritici CRL 75-36-700-3]XP_003890622.1 hypothetical protein, variant [Puccinia graminis f. sp. tritici CRL 75-36-700-3]EFP75465.1 hypothetical protein PGTG_00796 [Puccinia graminis f. sp. tritici CRL 75-36-700-3]EHS63561.1 hypothetical protein, variant [Puccinia graminis f. sp. tritici CRL 75-36-700-3]KAA1116223.1 hypothetical protein PGT21_005210 [Puccinia graminis f. sp. tritici]
MRFTVAIAAALAALSSVSAQNGMQCGVNHALIPLDLLQSNSCSMTGMGGGPNFMQCGGDAGDGFFGLGAIVSLDLLQQNKCSMSGEPGPFDSFAAGGGLFRKEANNQKKDDKKA